MRPDLPLFRGRKELPKGNPPDGLDRTFESRNLRRDVRQDSAVVRQLLPRGLPSRCRIPGGTDVVFSAPAPTAFPFVVPEVQVSVPVDPMHAETAADPHENPLLLPLFRGRIRTAQEPSDAVRESAPGAAAFKDDNLPTTPL